jgi:hypothetical protein
VNLSIRENAVCHCFPLISAAVLFTGFAANLRRTSRAENPADFAINLIGDLYQDRGQV